MTKKFHGAGSTGTGVWTHKCFFFLQTVLEEFVQTYPCPRGRWVEDCPLHGHAAIWKADNAAWPCQYLVVFWLFVSEVLFVRLYRYVVIYIDNILVYSHNLEEHLGHVNSFLR